MPATARVTARVSETVREVIEEAAARGARQPLDQAGLGGSSWGDDT